jgi:hypothetical protein
MKWAGGYAGGVLRSLQTEGEYLPGRHRQDGRAACGPVTPIHQESRETFDRVLRRAVEGLFVLEDTWTAHIASKS